MRERDRLRNLFSFPLERFIRFHTLSIISRTPLVRPSAPFAHMSKGLEKHYKLELYSNAIRFVSTPHSLSEKWGFEVENQNKFLFTLTLKLIKSGFNNGETSNFIWVKLRISSGRMAIREIVATPSIGGLKPNNAGCTL